MAGLDYLGLGDWHGQIRVTGNTWYSGTPEPDSFKHNHSGQALIVAVDGAGAVPEVSPVSVGEIHWQRSALELTPQDDIAALVTAMLPPLGTRRDTLFQMVGRGRLGVQQMQALRGALAEVTPDFLSFGTDMNAVQMAHNISDLEAIDASGGALRQAADSLSARAQDGDLSADDRRLAATALSQLFSFVAEQSE